MLIPLGERSSGCVDREKETFFRVEATPRRRIEEAWLVKGTSLLRG